jgi:pimeloyl-ACP methyl ester carboxylesterase
MGSMGFEQTFPPAVAAVLSQLTEPTSQAMAAQIRFQAVQTPITAAAIQTAYVQQGAENHSDTPPTPKLTPQLTPMLWLHGFDSSLLEYRRLWPRFHQPRWAVDLFGFGFTERPTGSPFSAAAIKTHLFHTWQQLINEPVTLLAASMGGATALDFALSYPDCVRQLVLIDSAGVQPGPPGKLLVPPLGWLATEFLRSPKVRQKISCNAYHDPSYASADAQACAASHLQVPGWRESLIRFTQSGGYRSLEKQLPSLNVPTLILWGESDRILGTKDAGRLQRAIPGSQLTWIAEAGHVPHLEQPAAVAQMIQDWLSQNEPGQSAAANPENPNPENLNTCFSTL